MKIRLAALATALAASVASAALTGCGQDNTAGEIPGGLRVVASTNVWGSVATAVGGDAVNVTAIISDPGGDPHSYQMTPKDAAALSGAELVVFNGGGYDEFVEQALDDAGTNRPTVEAFALAELDEHDGGSGSASPGAPTGDPSGAPSGGPSGAPSGPPETIPERPETNNPTEPSTEPSYELEHGHEHGENEHVWYDLTTVGAVADEIAARLGQIRPDSKSTFEANAKSFRGELDELTGQLEQIAQTSGGAKVAATEPLAHYLFEDAGLEDVTPQEFVEAIEEETDPPAAAVAEIQRLAGERQVSLLVHNPQTETPVVADVVTKAREANLPIVEMTETLPAGRDYLTWMTGQVEALASALKQR